VNFLATIDEKARQRKLRFLVIGGLAINHYGYSRDTSDLDLFVSQREREKWIALLSEFGYTSCEDGGNFLQYSPPSNNAWPVDLMLVQEPTFVPIFEASKQIYSESRHVCHPLNIYWP
jgi:hypothetical protein